MPNVSFEGVVILASPRSGTTLFQRILGMHPSLSGPPETNVLNSTARFLREHPVSSGFGVGVVSGMAFAGMSEDELHRRAADFALGLLASLRQKAGKPLWVEKSPNDMFHVPVIARLCGDRVRYVWLVRHPLDVVCSIKEIFDAMGVYPPDIHEYVRRFPAPLEAFAHAWVDTNRSAQALAKTRPDHVVTLRYEDLLDDAPSELARILGFLGLDGDPAALLEAALAMSGDVGLGDWKTYEKRTLTRQSVGRWKELQTPVLSRLVAIIGPLAIELGYTDLPVPERLTPAEARRKYQLGRMVAHLKAAPKP